MILRNKATTYLFLIIWASLTFGILYILSSLYGIFETDFLTLLAIIYFSIGMPLMSAGYGIVSYKLTKRLLLSNVIFFVSSFASATITMTILWDIEPQYWFEETMETLPFIGIATAISLLFSVITMVFVKLSKKYEIKGSSDTEDTSMCD